MHNQKEWELNQNTHRNSVLKNSMSINFIVTITVAGSLVREEKIALLKFRVM